uniref:Pectate lyase n=1 Tax=Parastrongyloides trichosuri TaxID=131310 RepID=A0A0N4ZVV6_PARTI
MLCKGNNFILGFQGEFLCLGIPSDSIILSVESCNGTSGECVMATTTTKKVGNAVVGASQIAGSYDEFNLIISHDCVDCSGALRLPIPYNAVNCGEMKDNSYNFGKIELTDPEYC